MAGPAEFACGLNKRSFILGALGLSLPAAGFAAESDSSRHSIRIASNQGVENATIQQLMASQPFAGIFGLDPSLVVSRDIAGPLDDLVHDRADICMISAFAGILPAIEQGAPVRLVSTAMRLPALALYASDPQIRRVRDLAGRRLGIGGKNGLLHLLTIALLRKQGIDAARVEFVEVGSNAEVLKAVAEGRVDAGLSGPAGLSLVSRAHRLADGSLWQELPDYPYQMVYASQKALHERGEAVARCLAAYALMFRFLSGPQSREAYLAARRAAGGADAAEGEQVWQFIQQVQPYARKPGIAQRQVSFLQQLNLSVGLQKRLLANDAVIDDRPARRARQLLGQVRPRPDRAP